MKIPFLNQLKEKSKLGLKGLCVSLGKHNDALYAVLAIAVFKGIFRPTFTMMERPEMLGQVEHSMSFLAVCLSAGVIIPAVCNLTLKPLMDLYKGFQKKRNCGLEKHEEMPLDKKLDIKENVVKTPVALPVSIAAQPAPASGNLITLMQNNMALKNAGMKVGG